MDMKSFENCNVALCFSGQSRTFEQCAESVKSFFSSDKGNKYYFFGHTSNKNNYKDTKTTNGQMPHTITLHKVEEKLDIQDLRDRLEKVYNFEKLVIENENETAKKLDWRALPLYSMMYSNFLKQQYEVENNMMFDVVIRLRFDLCFLPGKKFEQYVNFLIEEKTLYSNFGLSRGEFVLPNPDQTFHFGSSFTMDLVDSFYNSFVTGGFAELVNLNIHSNNCFNRVADGALIHKWITIKNILPIKMHTLIPFAIVRLNNKHLDYTKEFEKIRAMGTFSYVPSKNNFINTLRNKLKNNRL